MMLQWSELQVRKMPEVETVMFFPASVSILSTPFLRSTLIPVMASKFPCYNFASFIGYSLILVQSSCSTFCISSSNCSFITGTSSLTVLPRKDCLNRSIMPFSYNFWCSLFWHCYFGFFRLCQADGAFHAAVHQGHSPPRSIHRFIYYLDVINCIQEHLPKVSHFWKVEIIIKNTWSAEQTGQNGYGKPHR